MKLVKRIIEKYPKTERFFKIAKRVLILWLAFTLGMLYGWYARGAQTKKNAEHLISAGAEVDAINYEELAPVYVGLDLTVREWCIRPSEVEWKITSSNGDYIYNSNEGGTFTVTAVSSMYGVMNVPPDMWTKFGSYIWPSNFVVSAIEVKQSDGTYAPTFNTYWFYDAGVRDVVSYEEGVEELLEFQRENNVYLLPVTSGMNLYGKYVVCVSTTKEWYVYFNDSLDMARLFAYFSGGNGYIVNGSGIGLSLEPWTKTYVMFEGEAEDLVVTSMTGDVALYVAMEPGGGDGTYNAGYSDGYGAGRQDGYEEGYDARTSEEAGIRTEYFQAGYEEGYREGKEVGEHLSYGKGYREGYAEGDENGYRTGYVAGQSSIADNSTSFFSQLFAVFDVELFGGITIGHIVLIPIILGLLAVVFKVFGR